MAKVKNHIIEDKSDYLMIAVNIGICLCCVFMIGRVGVFGNYLSLFFAFLVGDFSTLLLVGILISTIINIIFKRKVDVHHIFFVGAVFIFLGLQILCHIGLYDSLGMNNKNILSKTITLYKHYLSSYQISYSCGGGLIGGALLQISCLLIGKLGGAILGVALILIGLSYFTNMKLLDIFNDGKITLYLKKSFMFMSNYFKNIKVPSKEQIAKKKATINDLEDINDISNFVLQNEINKEKFEDFKNFAKENRLCFLVDGYHTSYSFSRFVLTHAKINDIDMKKIINYFGRQVILFKIGINYYIDCPNQFRKVLTLKNMISETKKEEIPLMKDINGKNHIFNINFSKSLVIIGDENSGVKNVIQSLIASMIIRGVIPNDIYLYDFKQDFKILGNSKLSYVTDEKSGMIALDRLFEEYERRLEVLKCFNLESIAEINDHIKKENLAIDSIMPITHIFNVNLTEVQDAFISKIVYAIRYSEKVGINLIVCCRNKNELSKLELNKMDIMCLNISDLTTSVKLFGNDMALQLLKKGDALLRMNNTVYHGQTPYISTNDFEKICFK